MPAPVLVTGATGYIGGRLVPELLDAGHPVRVLARSPGKLAAAEWRDRVEVVEGDIADTDGLAEAMDGVRAAYFLVHSMGGSEDFAERDRRNAESFRVAAERAGVERIVYLGGLGKDDDELSEHLASRHEVGRILADGPLPVFELRAAVIIGSGSASFEMLRNLTEVLPVMVTPKWVQTRCQPIAIRDILHYLVGVLDLEVGQAGVYEVGGADVLTYEEMMQTYAEVAGLRRRRVVRVPVLSPSLSSRWVGLVTPLPTALARPLVDSLVNEVVVRERPVSAVIDHDPVGFAEALDLALRRIENLDVRTRWTDATLPGRTPADPLPTDPDWAGGTLLIDTKETRSSQPAERLFAVVAGVGGERGWYVAAFLWDARGWIDKLAGGVGMRRGRRHPDELRVGDALDFWRVEAYDPPRLLRLRAEMKLPGEGWLEWTITGEGDDERLMTQRAIFAPRGIWGRLYWYAMLPFHALIFRRMLERMGAAADDDASDGGGPVRLAS